MAGSSCMDRTCCHRSGCQQTQNLKSRKTTCAETKYGRGYRNVRWLRGLEEMVKFCQTCVSCLRLHLFSNVLSDRQLKSATCYAAQNLVHAPLLVPELPLLSLRRYTIYSDTKYGMCTTLGTWAPSTDSREDYNFQCYVHLMLIGWGSIIVIRVGWVT